MITFLTRLLEHPATRGLDLDSPETTELRAEIVRSKPFLQRIYREWAHEIATRLPVGDGRLLELGAGGGILKDFLPDLITTDVFLVPDLDCVLDARHLPFTNEALRGIVMSNVLHHIPDVGRFLDEAQRCLRPGGRIVAIEPWNTPWSKLVHERLHHEPFLPEANEWAFPTTGPLSGANAALPWITTERDRDRLEATFQQLRVAETTPFMPFRYLASGGVSMRSLQPGWAYRAWRAIDELPALARRMALFAIIVIERR